MLFFGIIVVLCIFYVISSYNSFVSYGNKVDEAFSTMDVYLKKRYDLIPNLVEIVKGYAKHESETFEKVVSARNKALTSSSVAEKIEAEKEVNSTLGRLLAITEAYPDLKANTNFVELQKELTNMEGEILSARKYYNGVVRQFNTLTEKFPSNLIASIFKFEKQPMFSITNESERENISIKF